MLAILAAALGFQFATFQGFAEPQDAAPKADPGPIPIPVRSEHFTVTPKPGILGTHPRLYLNSQELAALQSRVKEAAFAPIWSEFLHSADQTAAEVPPLNPANTEDPFRRFGDRLPRLALAYIVSGDDKYLTAARSWITAILSYPSWAGDQDLGAGHVCFGMALAYDWLYTSLLPEERAAIETKLLLHGRLLMEVSTNAAKKPPYRWGTAYFQNHSWICNTGIATSAMALYDLAPGEMQSWIDWTRGSFEPLYRNFGLDGSNYEGPAYLRYGTLWMLQYIELLRSFSGEDLSSMPYLKRVGRFLLDTLMPDGRSVVHFGDTPVFAWEAIDEPILAWLASHGGDPTAEWIRQTNRAAWGKPPHNSPFAMLWLDPNRPAQSPQSLHLPLTGLYPDWGFVSFRTGWDKDAAAVAFRCGPPGGHHITENWSSFPGASASFGHAHPDANSFIFWSDRQWRIALPGQYTHLKRTSNENVWLADGMGQRGEEKWMRAETYLGKPSQATLLRVATSTTADYVIGEAAPAYEWGADFTSIQRHLLFIKGAQPYIVTLDLLAASRPVTWQSFLHTFGPITLEKKGSFFADGRSPAAPNADAPPSAPDLVTYGFQTGPSGFFQETGPLVVISHPTDKEIQSGYELKTSMGAAIPSTWLVTVIGPQRLSATVSGTYPDLTVCVGNDSIAWRKQSGEINVYVNKSRIKGNLLSPAPSRLESE
ncbi:MAG: DUF4962 domain-containing protein [Chthoniobacteraceae bacterium]